ncbi:hypothetical protein KLMIMM047B_07890 [Klebsiella michiganensis]|uniref:hypothetical protein n=1 Tax=Klebsiella michiganensis TaxID=1134687 RepID=UPI003B27880E
MNKPYIKKSNDIEVQHLKAGDKIDFIHLSKSREIEIIAAGPDGKIWITWEDGSTSRYAPDCVLVKA